MKNAKQQTKKNKPYQKQLKKGFELWGNPMFLENNISWKKKVKK